MDDLILFLNRLEDPEMTWDSSYHLLGFHSRGRKSFSAHCKLCSEKFEWFDESVQAIDSHFKHCSRYHGYVFPENATVRQAEGVEQEIIIASMLYDLPLPGFEQHKNCVKQYRSHKIVCIIHY